MRGRVAQSDRAQTGKSGVRGLSPLPSIINLKPFSSSIIWGRVAQPDRAQIINESEARGSSPLPPTINLKPLKSKAVFSFDLSAHWDVKLRNEYPES